MWPIIIAEELVAARRALLVADTASTLLGYDDDQKTEGLRHASLEDDDIYYYLLAKGLFKYMQSTTGKADPSNTTIFGLVDASLCSSIYRSAAPDVDNSVAAFCTAFANELLMHDVNYVTAVKSTIQHIEKSATVPFLLPLAAGDVAFVTDLKKHLATLHYDNASIELVVKAFKDGQYKTPKLNKYIAGLGSGTLSMSETWLSLIYSILTAGQDNSSEIYSEVRKGGLVLNSYLIPYWRPIRSTDAGKRPTYMERSLSKGDIDRAERAQMIDKGYQMDEKSRTWVPRATALPPEPTGGGSGKVVKTIAETLIANRVLGGLSKFRNAKRLAGTTKALPGGTTKQLK